MRIVQRRPKMGPHKPKVRVILMERNQDGNWFINQLHEDDLVLRKDGSLGGMAGRVWRDYLKLLDHNHRILIHYL